jgi:hypothetical protein
MRSAGTLLVASLCLVLPSCRQYALPPIKNPEQLRKDCALLYQQFQISTNHPFYTNSHNRLYLLRVVPKDKWPPSVSDLKPRFVYTDYFGVSILIYSGNSSDKGYYLQFNRKESAPRTATHGLGRYYLTNSPYMGIDMFVYPYIRL